MTRLAIAGTTGLLGLMLALGVTGFFSLLGTEPDEQTNGLSSKVETIPPGEFDGPFGPRAAPQNESEPGSGAAVEGAPASPSPTRIAQPTAKPLVGVLAAAQPGQTVPTTAPTAAPMPQTTPNMTATPTVSPPTPTPLPCSSGGTPVLSENGKHVRIENGTVVAWSVGVLVLDVGGTSVILSVTTSTEVLGNLDAATLVRAEGIRASDGSVTAALVEVLCPDSARA